MRIISGSHKGRNILAPKNLPVRPTTDLAKESLFNILNNHFDFNEIKVLDLFCGTGNISYEFASRGAMDISAVDKNYQCFTFVKKTSEILGFKNIKVFKSDVFSFIKHSQDPFDIIFADPPYELDKIDIIPGLIFEKQLLNPNGWLIMEHSAQSNFQGTANLLERRNYGKVNFSIFEKE